MEMVSVKCPACGDSLTALNKHDLATAFKKHAHHHHDMDMTEEQAREKVEKQLAAGSDQ